MLIGSGRDLRIEVCGSNQCNKSKLSITFTLIFLLNGYTQAARRSASVIKVGVISMGVCLSRCLKKSLLRL